MVALASSACRPAAAPAAVEAGVRCVAVDGTLRVGAADLGAAVVGAGGSQHGAATVAANGDLVYSPAAGFTGDDVVRVTLTDAIERRSMPREVLATVDGVMIDGAAHGSAWTGVPGAPGEFYGLADRGPNVDGAGDDTKVFAMPAFTPSIARYAVEGGALRRVATIPLRDLDGAPLSGLVPPAGAGATHEAALELDGRGLAPDRHGVDPEGLVALADGSFWVGEEYGPSLLHVGADGRVIERITPFAANPRGHRLPAVLARRTPNRGIEGLGITPDGATIVGVMQSALSNEISEKVAKKTPTVRLFAFDPASGAARTFLYLLDDPAALGTVASEVAVLSATEVLVLERDGEWPGAGAASKRIYRATIAEATDVGAGAGVDPERGLLIDGQTIEARTAGMSTSEAREVLAAAGVRVAEKRLEVDVLALLEGLDPRGRIFAHDKLEGLAVIDGGRRVVIANDSDFGVDAPSAGEGRIAPKRAPTTGDVDFGEVLWIDLARLPATTRESEVRVRVTASGACE